MSYTPSYPQRINFENDPSTATPLNQTNLNKMDNAIYQHDLALSAQDERISGLESEDKVTSFKGRTGVVTPADDDYTIAQIKATGSEGQIPALNAQGKLEMVTPNKAGHDIVDKVGNVMTTRDNLQFVGAVSVTDDATNNKTIVNVTGGGGGGGGHTIEDTDGTTMPQEENLQFVGLKVTDDSINGKTIIDATDKADKTDIATVESGTTASRAYPVGELVYVSGTLYRVKTAIASGATFTVGTNVEVTNVSQSILKHVNKALGTKSCPVGVSQIDIDIPLSAFNVCPYISSYPSGSVRQVILTMMKSSSSWIICVNNVSSATQNVSISVDYTI